jgi:hypothetical protein
MRQVLGAFVLLDFTMLRPVLSWRTFLNLWTIHFFNFPNLLGGRGQLWITETTDTESADMAVWFYLNKLQIYNFWSNRITCNLSVSVLWNFGNFCISLGQKKAAVGSTYWESSSENTWLLRGLSFWTSHRRTCNFNRWGYISCAGQYILTVASTVYNFRSPNWMMLLSLLLHVLMSARLLLLIVGK